MNEETLRQATDNFQGTFERLHRFVPEWLRELDALITRLETLQNVREVPGAQVGEGHPGADAVKIPGRISPVRALAEGYTLDKSTYPWVAYKGPRVNPTSTVEVFTDLEYELQDALVSAQEIMFLTDSMIGESRDARGASFERIATYNVLRRDYRGRK